MADRPPVYRHPGWKETKPWARPERQKDRRLRGRPGMRARAQVLAEEPLCRLCLAAGRNSRSDVVDHIMPLAWGGAEARHNRQALCQPCHDEKSRNERALARRSSIEDRV